MVKKPLMAAVVVLWLAAFNASATTYTSLAVFGDSLLDGGNALLYTKFITGGSFPPPPYAGRASNGPTAAENLATGLGLSLKPSMDGGTNYAFIGAETGTANYLRVRPDVPVIINQIFSGQPNFPNTGTLAQVTAFASAPPAGFDATQSLVVLWAGANDLFTALTVDPLGFAADPYNKVVKPALDNLVQSIALLYGAGVRDILVPNLPNLGVTPFGLGSDPAGLSNFSAFFNFLLDLNLDALEVNPLFSGLNIIESDTFSLLTTVVGNPAAYGFTNWTQPCYDGVSACANPDEYVFWDGVHPTAHTHAILGAAFAQAVPEPPALLLVAVGLAGMMGSRRVRRSL